MEEEYPKENLLIHKENTKAQHRKFPAGVQTSEATELNAARGLFQNQK